jgi:hypothetical protein
MAVEDPPEVEVERDGRPVLVAGTWRPPTHSILRERLDEARKWLEINLAPCGPEGVQRILMPLLMTTTMPHTAGMEETTLQSFFAQKSTEYTRLLQDLPADILSAACDECAKASPFFPAVADLFRHAKPALEKRRRQCERVDRLIAMKSAPPQGEPFKPEPEIDRYRADIARWKAHGDVSFGINLKARAIESEKKLATLEGRDVEDWARASAPVELDTASVIGRTADHVLVDELATPQPRAPEWKRAPDAWQAGQPLYQRAAEEPPPPTEIPEAGDIEVEP